MNYVQKWFIGIAALLSVGIPLLFLGILLPNALNASILEEAAKYVILDEDDNSFWAELPGRTGMTIIKSFYLYNCTNPELVASMDVDPTYVEVGPFDYVYSHNLVDRQYSNEEDIRGSRVSFRKEFRHEYTDNPEKLRKEYRVINLAGMKRWESAKSKLRFQMAIEGFFETFIYARNHLVRDLIINKLIEFYINVDNIRRLANNLHNVTDEVKNALIGDPKYGLSYKQNIYEWSLMCHDQHPYIEHEIIYYFGFSLENFAILKETFCRQYDILYNLIHAEICRGIENCTNYNITFHQWMYGNVIQGSSYNEISFKNQYGIFEFANYTKLFLSRLKSEYKRQFTPVKWNDKAYHYLLDTYFEYPDFITDDASLFLYDNMRQLFKAGAATKNPFEGSSPSQSAEEKPLDLMRFENIAMILKLTKEQAFMLYCFFDYYINNTVLLSSMGGNIEKERVANYGALVLKDISSYYSDYIDLLIYSRALNKQTLNKTCDNLVKEYFHVPETEHILESLSATLCKNKKFNTNITTALGWKYFIEAVSYPHHFSYNRLFTYLNASISNFTSAIFEKMMFGPKSTFLNTLNDIRMKVKSHYRSKLNNIGFNNKFSPYCTKRQFFFAQFYTGGITAHPYEGSDLPKADYISDWRSYIEPYIEYSGNFSSQGIAQNIPLPDQLIFVPTELPFLESVYKKSDINLDNLYNCFNLLELYDTDIIYNVLLKINKMDKPKTCAMFSTTFFYNAIRYLIRNVQFGPLFAFLKPEETYFGYFNEWIDTEHKFIDYLEGDDCTVNPWTGYNPKTWNMKEKTLEHFTYRHKMKTGILNNNEIRQYTSYYDDSKVLYEKLVRDITGDKCSFRTAYPFIESMELIHNTDGLQFAQNKGRTKKGDIKLIMDDNSFRPLELVRITNAAYTYREFVVNDYSLNFEAKYYCANGVYFKNAFDMTSFLQYKSILTRPRYNNFDEPNLKIPKIDYKYPIEDDSAPEGFTHYDSYYAIEPYMGITMEYKKKMMMSLVMYYDELFMRPTEKARGETIPYYAFYEKAYVSNAFLDSISSKIFKASSTRKQITNALITLGLFCIIVATIMMTKACFFKPAQILESNISTSIDFSSVTSRTIENPLLNEKDKEDMPNVDAQASPEVKVTLPVVEDTEDNLLP